MVEDDSGDITHCLRTFLVLTVTGRGSGWLLESTE